MNKITYTCSKQGVRVLSGYITIGKIIKIDNGKEYGYKYYPKNSDTPGELFKSLIECKQNLEEIL